MDLIDNDLVLLDQTAGNKDDVLHMLADLVETAGRLNDKALFIEELYQREAEAPTNIGFSTAIPHGRTGRRKRSFADFYPLEERNSLE